MTVLVRRYGRQDYVYKASSFCGREKNISKGSSYENTPTELRIQHLEQVSELLDEPGLLIGGSIDQADRKSQ